MRERYKVTVEDEGSNSIVETIVGIIVLAIILFICMQCSDSSSSKSGQGTEEGYVNVSTGALDTSSSDVSVIPDRMALTDLYVFADHSDIINNICRGNPIDAYGHTYSGPYLDLCSYGYGSADSCEAFTEFVADGNYKYFSGTFFARPEQNENYTIEFFVYADDVLVYSSGPITRSDRPIDFNVDISNCDIIRVASRSTDFTMMNTNPGIILFNAEVYN